MTKSIMTFVVRDKGVEIQKTDGRKLSEDVLLLLSLVADSTAAKVNAVRRAGKAPVTAEDDKKWAEKLEAMRSLAGGKSPCWSAPHEPESGRTDRARGPDRTETTRCNGKAVEGLSR